ncbi:MAG: GntR family transcriptional regulator [Acetivibrio sp.]
MTEERLPKYYIVKRKLVERIEAEEFSEGEPIVSERELMEEYQVSRITIRKAIDELVNEGYLYRIQGKGTYVKNEEESQDLFSIKSCTEDVKKLGKNPSKKTIVARVIEANNKRAKQLHLSIGDKLFQLGRVTYADEEPLNYTITYLPVKLFPGIEKYNLEKESLYEILNKKYGVKLVKARRTVEAVLAEDEIAEYLDISTNMPVILFGCVTYGLVNGKEIPVEYFKCYYRTDHYKFYIDQVNLW